MIPWLRKKLIETPEAPAPSAPRPFVAPPMKPQKLGPKQLAWLEERFQFYGIHRKQAEAPTGVAVVQSPGDAGRG